MMLDQEAIDNQFALLATHRRTLAHLLQQAAQFGGEVFAPPYTANGIAAARAEIQRIKAILRQAGMMISDEPNDERPPYSEPVTPVPSGGDVRRDHTLIASVQPPFTAALHQLRAPIGDFVGREREIERLVQALSKAASGGASAAIGGVRGMGGIGKTELVYTVAQRLAEHLRDAQLIVELRGASRHPLTPAQALQQVVRSFEREAQLPDELSQLQALYRSTLSGMRTLIVADDAMDAAQVRPLLPPPGSALLITSRQRFSLPGMAMIDLHTLPPEDAERLLLEICPRIGGHAKELAKLCGYLPLALRVSASLLANSSRGVARYLEQLAAERLKHLADPDDPQAGVEASLHVSYDTLTTEAQQALCQISVFAASFDLAAAQAVVVIDGDVPEALELLRRRSLLEWDAPVERFGLHDLVRAFAAARLEDINAVQLRHAQYYVEVAAAAQRFYLTGGAATLKGLALLDQERLHIDAGWSWAQSHAGDQDADTLLLDYAEASVYIGDLRYDTRRERIPQLEAALAAARRRSDRNAEGARLGNLGNAYTALGDARQAITHNEQYLTIAREIGDRRGEGQALGNLALAYRDIGDARQAITYDEQRLAIAREMGDRRSKGVALGNLGLAYADVGEARQAISYHEQHLASAREMGDRRGEGKALSHLGRDYRKLGEARQAITYDEQRLAIAREMGDRQGEGNALGNLGLAYAALGEARRAISYHEQALDIHRELGNRRSEAVASWNLGLALEQAGNLTRAAELMGGSLAYFREVGHPDAEKRAARLAQLQQRVAGETSGTIANEGAASTMSDAGEDGG
jgi:tetratricopeptide (TPR) repeat protein